MAGWNIQRMGEMFELEIICSKGGKISRCSRNALFYIPVTVFYLPSGERKTKQMVLDDLRRITWLMGWRERPKGKGGGFLCPECKGQHDPASNGRFPRRLTTPK